MKWKFSSEIAEIFDIHARQHIPKYEEIINQNIDICKKLLKKDALIIDLGCATGYTLYKLYNNKFTNLIGVDASKDMLTKVKSIPNLKLIHSSVFPKGKYDAVICNWTLHFIQEKIQYLQNIYDSLDYGGFLILSEKTYNNGIELDLYHDFKKSQGVSDQKILEKAESLKGIMFIDPPEWYITVLKDIGFKVTIINASFCFTTFLATK